MASESVSQRKRQVNSGCTACAMRKSRIGLASARENPSSVRVRLEHLVGVPDLAERLGVAFLLEDFENLRVPLHPLHKGMMVDVAEALGEGDLLLGRDFLVAEEHDEVLEPGGLDFVEGLLVEVAEVGALDLRPERAGNRLHLDVPIRTPGFPPQGGNRFMQ